MKPDSDYLMRSLIRAARIFDSSEEMWNFYDKHNIDLLSSTLDRVFMQIDGVDLYIDLVDKISHIFYFIIKDHMFPNGNKRTATIVATILFIYNDKELVIDDNCFYNLACDVASSESSDKDEPIEQIKATFTSGIRELNSC